MNIRLATSAVVAAAGAVLLAVSPAATAMPTEAPVTAPAKQTMPDFKGEFPVTVKGAQITYRGQEITADLTGKAGLSIEAPTPGKLETKATGTLKASADHPDLGRVTIESKATGTASFNSAVNPFPATLDLSADATVTLDGGQKAQPVKLTPKSPAQLTGKLDQFPPTGRVLGLKNPVDLVDANNETVATIDKFPLHATK